jgi:ABC-2 type transport system permease protein
MKKQILSITNKELSSYFGSPLAIIFLGSFLAAVLFIFFTVEAFFVRGVADVRPLFRWMPVLLIFLMAALTMRQWSEEQRSGTQELLLTLPVNFLHLVLGKFLAVMGMIGVALALTLPLPITVSILGNLDWGPVIGGYLAALLMAGAYAAIGLFVSSRTDNQIVALISTVLLGGLFYLLGTRGVTDFVGGGTSEILWSLGTGSRFESIQRGVIDLRDLVYYASLTAFFLMLNTVSLDSVRWSPFQEDYRRKVTITTGLLGLNLLLLNVWLFPLQGLRLDLTAQREYSLSQTTKDLFDNLGEPLLIRGYISEKTHPLLAPLVPRIRDMFREYEIAANGQVTAEVIDPIQDPEAEAEANQTYGIRPMPFQVSDRYEASVINSYFDILIRYGDQTVILNFQDLIQVDAPPSGSIDVRLRNLEYDLTRGIKRVVFGFQSVDAVLAALDEPVTLSFYISSATMPASLVEGEQLISSVANEIEASADGKFIYQLIDLDAPDSPVNQSFLRDTYGLEPFPVSFFSTEGYYAHMIMESGDEAQLIYPPANLSEGEIRTTIESALKRGSSGFLKVVGIWTPPAPPPQNSQFGGPPPAFSDYNLIREQLSQEYTVKDVDLATGQLPPDVDILLVMGPRDLGEMELFAIDQFLMRGGAVTMALNPYQVGIDQFSGNLLLQPNNTGLDEWLGNHGVTLSQSLVLDEQNQPFPVPVLRQVGGFQVQEIQAVDYPLFVDIRPDGMDTDNPIAANLPAVTMNWASSIELGAEASESLETSILLQSSDSSWLRADTSIQPDFVLYPEWGFAIGEERQSYPLAVSMQGSFESYFKDKPSPFETEASDEAAEELLPGPEATGAEAASPPPPAGTITASPESSRLVVIGSAAFAEDSILNLSSQLVQDGYLNNLQFLQNVVDWSVEDLDLLAIRSRGSTSRALLPMDEGAQSAWEIANYIVALLALVGIYYAWRVRGSNEIPMELVPVSTEVTE